MNFALGLFNFILAILIFNFRSSRDSRAALQIGFWGPKVILWLALVVLIFFIPESFFQLWGQYFALAGAMLFVLLGLIPLVDLAHTWAEYCLRKIEEYNSKKWRVLIGSTLGMDTASFALTILMYILFANKGCAMNQAAITICHLPAPACGFLPWIKYANQQKGQPYRLLLIISAISVHPTVQEHNPQACPVRDGSYLLHISDHVRHINGTPPQQLQSIIPRQWHSRCFQCYGHHSDYAHNRTHNNPRRHAGHRPRIASQSFVL